MEKNKVQKKKTGRPKKFDTMLFVNISQFMSDLLDNLSKKTKHTKSELVRIAIENLITKLDKSGKL